MACTIVRLAVLTKCPTGLVERLAVYLFLIGQAHLFKTSGVMLMTTISFITSNVKRRGNAKNSSLRPSGRSISREDR